MKYRFRLAIQQDHDAVLSLYSAVKDLPFCTWNDLYPTGEEIERDLAAKSLYVLTEEEHIIGSISVVPSNELDEYGFWEVGSRSREIARVAVLPAHRGLGLALTMEQETERILRSEKVDAIHLLAAVDNLPACKTYEKAGYQIKSKIHAYGNYYYAMEKNCKKTVIPLNSTRQG